MVRNSKTPIFSAILVSLAFSLGGTAQAFASAPQLVAIERSALIAEIERNCVERKLVDRIPSLVATFERRMTDNAQIEKTYQEIREMLAAASSVTSVQERAQLAAEVIEQAACPLNIDQGRHNTCAFAALEARTYTLYPCAAAALVKQVALTGRYITGGNDEIEVDAKNVHPDGEAMLHGYGSRSFASQLFQITAANVYWQRQDKDPNGIKCGRGDIRYIQKAGISCFRGDTGERLEIHRASDVVETVVDQVGTPMFEPCVALTEVQDVGTVLAQVPQKMFVIASKKFNKQQKYLPVKSMEDLRRKLSDCQSGSAMPLVVAVDLRRGWLANEPMMRRVTANMGSNQQTSRFPQGRLSNDVSNSRWHAVCITAYNLENDTVSIDNFWGPHADHVGDNAIPVSELYAAIALTD